MARAKHQYIYILVHVDQDDHNPKGKYPGENVEILGVFKNRKSAREYAKTLFEDFGTNLFLYDNSAYEKEGNTYFDIRKLKLKKNHL